MKAAIVTAYGSSNNIVIQDVENPTIGPKDVLVRMHATTVSSADGRILHADPPIIRLVYGFQRPRMPLGASFSGVVERVGDSVTTFKPGDAVFGTTDAKMSTHAELVKIGSDKLILHRPSAVSAEAATCLSFGFSTAQHFLRKAKLQQGESLFVIGGAGAVGSAAIQLAVHMGATVTAVCGPEDVARMKSLGASKVLDYTLVEYADYGKDYAVIFDTVGKIPLSIVPALLADKGRHLSSVHIAPSRVLQGIWISLTTNKTIQGGLSIENRSDLEYLAELAASGAIKPVIGKTYDFKDIVKAYQVIESGHKTGNTVVTF